MRGTPLLRVVVLAIALVLTGVLVATVLGNARPSPGDDEKESTAPVPDATLVPTLLTVTLSGPAKSLSFAEPSGRVISVPTDEGLELERDVELSVDRSSWSASLAVEWENPDRPHFLRLHFEPRRLKSSEVLLHFDGNTSTRPISTTFDPGP